MNFAHTRVGRNPLTTASGVLTLAVVGFGGGRGDGASEDRKIEEIAQILGKSSGAVKLLLHRAVERLRRELPPEFEIGVT